MKIKKLKIKTLKNKIILYFMIITIFPAIFLTFFYYKNTNQIYEKNMLENAFDDIYYIKRSIDERFLMAKGFADWFYINNNFDDILTEDFNNNPEYDYEMIKVYKQIQQQLVNSPLGNYISSLVIVGDNKVKFRYGTDSSMINIEKIGSTDWFKKGMSQNGVIYWPGIIENPAEIKASDYVIPIARPIYHTKLYKKIGWMFIAFKEELISEIYASNDRNNANSNSYTYFVLDQQGNTIPHNLENDFMQKEEMEKNIYNILDQGNGYFRSADDEALFVFEKLDRTDWILVERLPLAGLKQQKKVLTKISFAILISSIIFTSLLIVFLSSNLTAPLKKLVQHVNKISKGDFDSNSAIEGDDEIGILGSRINQMTGNIKGLMGKIVEEEQEKRELELKALQNQINPHFLYNTLNSIKWMATVQGAEGIKNMVMALGRLLKNISSNTVEEISLREELELLEDYVFIQQIRYKGKIKFIIDKENEEILDCKILKFTLQPIIENSIFHGIEPRKTTGKIELIIRRDTINNDVIITVKDNGVGISEEQIRELLGNDNYTNNNVYQSSGGIGLSNVNSRLKMNYGSQYGLTIRSKAGEYTAVIIRIPCQS